MGSTKQIPRDEWTAYFDRFTRQHLAGAPPEAVTIELVSPTMGDQFEARTMRLLGLGYDAKSGAFEVQLEDMDHLAFQPSEIWVIEGDAGFISTVELAYADGSKELLHIQRSGPLAQRSDVPPPPQS